MCECVCLVLNHAAHCSSWQKWSDSGIEALVRERKVDTLRKAGRNGMRVAGNEVLGKLRCSGLAVQSLAAVALERARWQPP